MYKVRYMSRSIKLEIGAEGPELPDEIIELEVEVTDSDFSQMMIAYDKLMWDDDDLADLFDDYLADFKRKYVAMAMPLAIAQWGECAKVENGARYFILIPHEIEEEYSDSEAENKFYDAQDRMQENCRRQSKFDVGVLHENLRKGRWPHVKRALHDDILECWRFIGGMEATYSMKAQCNGITVDYGKRYKLQGSKIELDLYGNTSYRESLIDQHLRTCGRDIEVINYGYTHRIYISANEDESDIKIILQLLDQLESDTTNTI